MADSTIANLTSGTPAQATDVLPIQRASANFKLAVSDVLAAITSIPNGTTATTQAALSNDTRVATDAYADTSSANAAEAIVTGGSTISGPLQLVDSLNVQIVSSVSGVETKLLLQNGSGTGVSFDNGSGTGVVGFLSAGAPTSSINTSTNTLTVGTVNATAGYKANNTAGITAGNFTSVTSITTKLGLVTALSGTSDERLKNAIPYDGGLSEILAITPVRYRWNEKGQLQTGLPGDKDYVGFIAQNVQKSIPESITSTEPSKDGTEEYLSFDDRPILAALVNAVKILEARIKELESKKG